MRQQPLPPFLTEDELNGGPRKPSPVPMLPQPQNTVLERAIRQLDVRAVPDLFLAALEQAEGLVELDRDRIVHQM